MRDDYDRQSFVEIKLAQQCHDFGAGLRIECAGRLIREQQGRAIVPRSTVDWDTSQADDFRTRGEPWTIKRTRLECGRARRSERQGLARWRSGAAAGCHAS